MSLDDRTAQKHLTPEERRELLRAFADRMLLKVSAMDDPVDMPGVEKAVRVAAVIERIYYRCDRAERHTPDPRKVEAERATHKNEAIKARLALASTLEWGEKRQKQLGKWWDAAQTTAAPAPQPAPQPAKPQTATETPVAQSATPKKRPAPVSDKILAASAGFDETVYYPDLIKARANMGLPYLPPEKIGEWLRKPPRPV